MKFTGKKIFIFDLLGVITVEGMWATKVFFPLLNNVSYDLFKKKYLLYSLGLISRDDFWEYLVERVQQVGAIERKVIKKTVINEGVKKAIIDLKNNGFKIYLASEINERWGRMILKKAGIKHLFDGLYFSSSMLTTKPFKEFYKCIAADLSDSEEIYYLDDSLTNVLAAKKVLKSKGLFFARKANNHAGVMIINKMTDLKMIYEKNCH